MSDWRKAYRFGTFVIWPQGELKSISNALRQQYDPVSQGHCEAHITLTQPFVGEPDEDAWDQIEAIVVRNSPFQIYAGPVETFGSSAVLKFDIEPKSTIVALRNALHQTGLFNLSLPFTDGFIPHLTISESGIESPEQARTVAQALNERIQPLQFLCSEIAYIRPDEGFHFESVRTFVLGST